MKTGKKEGIFHGFENGNTIKLNPIHPYSKVGLCSIDIVPVKQVQNWGLTCNYINRNNASMTFYSHLLIQ